jgi:hypothetical protein
VRALTIRERFLVDFVTKYCNNLSQIRKDSNSQKVNTLNIVFGSFSKGCDREQFSKN